MPQFAFHPLIRDWFSSRFSEPTEAQRQGWPSIAAGNHTLIAAPTGSGKTLAAFLVCIDRLLRDWLAGELLDGVQVVYVSPLKALSNDIERNLNLPLAELRELATSRNMLPLPIRVGVRTGDTPQSERQAMLKNPPHILVTTPESLYLLLTSAKGREKLRTVRTVIVDEIHALARDKRGSHLALTLERLEALTERPFTRIGLSATQKPMEEIAAFLVGNRKSGECGVGSGECDTGSAIDPAEVRLPATHDKSHVTLHTTHTTPHTPRACTIVDTGHVRQLDLALDVPASELNAVCSNEQWGEIYERLEQLILSHRSTLVFVNTRRMAERIAFALTERLGEDAVASHHGSLSKELRLGAEQRLKAGQLKAIVATASLEMGIDIGYIDLVCQIGSPRAIATFLQRVGRSGHAVGALPKGRLFPITRDELLECLALMRSVRRRELDRIEIPVAPLDILAQQIVATAACDEWDEAALFEMLTKAWPYRDLSREKFDRVVQMLADGVKKGSPAGAYLHRDQINGRVRARRNARLAAITSGGAIPDKGEYRVVTEEENSFVGSVDEDFAIDSSAGDIFLLGNSSWRIRAIRGGEVIVSDAQGMPPTIPFWFGEAPGRTIELSTSVSEVRTNIGVRIGDIEQYATPREAPSANVVNPSLISTAVIREPVSPDTDPIDWLRVECGADPWSAEQAVRYVAAQKAAVGMVPSGTEILFERFFDESGGMQLVIHSPFGSRINRAWGLALRKRFCRSFDFELQAAADDNAVLLSLSTQHSFPIDALFHMLGPHNAEYLLTQAILAVPMFQVRWRWNVTRALAVLRTRGGKKVPPYLQKFRSEDLLASAFPETVGCLENHHGDVEVPDHPLVQQTMHDCLHEAMDLTRWIEVLQQVKDGAIKLVPIDTREPSPFSHQILNANPYAFLDDAPLEERRTRAVATRRTLSVDDFRDLARLDPAAVAQVTEEAWPIVRDPDELHDTLQHMVLLRESEGKEWRRYFEPLVHEGRAAVAEIPSAGAATDNKPVRFWFAAERLPFLQAIWPDLKVVPEIVLPVALQKEVSSADAKRELVRGRMQVAGPIAVDELAQIVLLPASAVSAAFEALEGEGVVMRGNFRERTAVETVAEPVAGGFEIPRSDLRVAQHNHDWCERRLLARIHRLTMDGLRRRIQPVAAEVYLEYLAKRQGLIRGKEAAAEQRIREVVTQLQGFELPAGAWEDQILAPRFADYDPQLLDQLFLSGELVWGRLCPPRRDATDGPALAAITRTIPVSLAFRQDLGWLLPEDRQTGEEFMGSNAKEVLNCLQQRGALFFAELKSLSGLLGGHVEDALRQLAALGLVTSDTFAAIRSLTAGSKSRVKSQRKPTRMHGSGVPVGRWSQFPGIYDSHAREMVIERWVQLLLNRYGVLFRDVLVRETAAPNWFEIVRLLRRMELRGEVRGGRFIAGVAGEQFALESAVNELRELRERPAVEDDWIVVNAADPVNLSGIVTAGPRITATHKNAVIYQRGRCVAAKVAGRIEFFAEIAPEQQVRMRRALQVGRKPRLVAADQSAIGRAS